jgi:hypothetical protein
LLQGSLCFSSLINPFIISLIKLKIADVWRFSATGLSLSWQRTNTHISVLASMLENMEEIYLSEKLKAEYLRDFNELVLSETHESWKIHPKSLFGFFSSSKPIFYEPGVIKIKLFISINALIFIYPEP